MKVFFFSLILSLNAFAAPATKLGEFDGKSIFFANGNVITGSISEKDEGKCQASLEKNVKDLKKAGALVLKTNSCYESKYQSESGEITNFNANIWFILKA